MMGNIKGSMQKGDFNGIPVDSHVFNKINLYWGNKNCHECVCVWEIVDEHGRMSYPFVSHYP